MSEIAQMFEQEYGGFGGGWEIGCQCLVTTPPQKTADLCYVETDRALFSS